MAITVDDLPHHGGDTPTSRLAIHQSMIATFARHRVPPVYGFVNARALEKHPDEEEALRAWVAAGNPLANHTYSHTDAKAVPEATFLADVDANEPILRRLMGNRPERDWKVLRYPYLREGRDLAAQASLRLALEKRGYRFAEVTIDFYDWAYETAYARCRQRGDTASVAGLRESFVDQAAHELRWADGAARELVRRPIRHVLLLHAADFTATMLDELLTTYEKIGARFVSLEAALEDPVYRSEPGPPAMPFGNFLWRVRKSRDSRTPAASPPPDTLLELVCK